MMHAKHAVRFDLAVDADVRLARQAISHGWSAVLVSRGIVIDREIGRGIIPALRLAERHQARLPASSCSYVFGDKVLGLAAFRLGAFIGARFMWGETASTLAIQEAERRGVVVESFREIHSVMDLRRQKLCPMEALAFACNNDHKFFCEAKTLLSTVLT